MVIDKLWLRIKGELLTLKDDISEGENLRARAERLLQQLDGQLTGATTDRTTSSKAGDTPDNERSAPEAPSAGQKPALRPIEEIEEEWRDLVRLRKETKAKPSPPEPPTPNPRKLG